MPRHATTIAGICFLVLSLSLVLAFPLFEFETPTVHKSTSISIGGGSTVYIVERTAAGPFSYHLSILMSAIIGVTLLVKGAKKPNG